MTEVIPLKVLKLDAHVVIRLFCLSSLIINVATVATIQCKILLNNY